MMRRGIALIELIFAIVVIAITLLAVPNLINQTTKSSKEAITQEAISNAASELDMIMSNFWDENCTNPSYNNPVLVVEKFAPELGDVNNSSTTAFTMPGMSSTSSMPGMPGIDDIFNMTKFIRVGSSITTSRRFLVINGKELTASLNNQLGFDTNDNTEPDDIDDYNGLELVLTSTAQNTTVEEGDYKDKRIKLNINVSYISDIPSTGYNVNIVNFSNPFGNIENNSTNIKMITLTLTSDNDPNKKVVLKSFSCNIGSGILKERVF